jgi:hypothetical protein
MNTFSYWSRRMNIVVFEINCIALNKYRTTIYKFSFLQTAVGIPRKTNQKLNRELRTAFDTARAALGGASCNCRFSSACGEV